MLDGLEIQDGELSEVTTSITAEIRKRIEPFATGYEMYRDYYKHFPDKGLIDVLCMIHSLIVGLYRGALLR